MQPEPDLAEEKPLKICLTSSEVTPLAKTGGLADVSASLSAYLHRTGHDVRLLMPFYSSIDVSGLNVVPVDYLQNIPISIGTRHGSFSIDTTVLPGSNLTIYLLRCPDLYHRSNLYTQDDDEHRRFILLARAAIEMCQRMSFAPDIFHCHDWHTSLIPVYLKTVYSWDRLFARTRSVLTIHNIGYQGVFTADISGDIGLAGAEHELHQEDLHGGKINFLKTGVLHADQLTTVSPTYAREIQGAEYGMGLQELLRARKASLTGILNGVDYAEWDPETDDLIPKTYSSRKLAGKKHCKKELMRDFELGGGDEQPLIGIVTRLVGQKGIDLLQKVLPELMQQRNFALAILGSGESRFERFFHSLQNAYRDRVCFYRGYNNRLAHWIEAGSDMFLMPSRYEPCGLNQMYSLRYGTVPIVRQTGGLADSVQLVDPAAGTGTGIVFQNYNEAALHWAINAALDLYADKPLWRKIMRNGMAMDFSWDQQGEEYVRLFRRMGETQ
jgi:starch synthase